jgi:hypothetical protein
MRPPAYPVADGAKPLWIETVAENVVVGERETFAGF